MEWEEAQRMARRHLERPMDGMDHSEGEKETKFELPQLNSVLTPIVEARENDDPAEAPFPSQKVRKKLYIVLISLHGLVRGDSMELGRDADTGEQVLHNQNQQKDHRFDESLYDGFNVKTERALRIRARRGISCHGRCMPRMVVIPPRVDFSNVVVQDAGDVVDDVDSLAFTNPDGTITTPIAPRAEPPIWSEVMRFFTNPHKPMILVWLGQTLTRTLQRCYRRLVRLRRCVIWQTWYVSL
ncbi:hypothetical protein R1sor_008038 [Riccia sorocarpa]|uniref:Uncharacterized protein n=1 Tax=Riccia sorocarpa TaxID=122646 RepID=A0ABD3HV33_9MARC